MKIAGQINSEHLMAFVDGQLSPDDARLVEAYIASNSDAGAEVTRLLRQNSAITTLFGSISAEPVPLRLRPSTLAEDRKGRHRRLLGWATTAVLLVGLGVAGGLIARPTLDAPAAAEATVIADALAAHDLFVAENRHAVEVAAAEQDHLVSWLSNRLDTDIAAPDLSEEGLTLLGGRLLPTSLAAGGRAAQLMYEDTDGERVTIYVTSALPDSAPRLELAGLSGAEAYYWADAQITCTVVGALSEPRMEAISSAVYSQLNADPNYREPL